MPAPTKPGRDRPVPLILQMGCAHLAMLLAAAGILLLVNTLAVSSAYQLWLDLSAGKKPDPRIAQAALIIGPLLLLFAQYWLYDRMRDWIRSPQDHADQD